MKLVLFGATGQIGRRSCKVALDRGHEVTAFVRDASRLPPDLTPRLNVVVGDVINKDDVIRAITGQEAVVSCLGRGTGNVNPHAMSEGLTAVLVSMKEAGVKRISVCLSTFLLWDIAKLPSWAVPATNEHRSMSDSLKSDKSGEIVWTAVLPPGFTDEPSSGGNYLVKHDTLIGRRISKEDLAEFMVDCLVMKEHENESCVISNSTEYLDQVA